MTLQCPASGSVRARAGPPKGEEARRFGDKSRRWEAELAFGLGGEAGPAGPELLCAEPRRRPRESSGPLSRPPRGGGARLLHAPRERKGEDGGGQGAGDVPQGGGRRRGAPGALPQVLRAYREPPHPLPDAGHRVRVRARSAAQLVRASVLWEGRARGSRPAPLSSPRFRRDPLKRAVNSVRTWLGLLPRLLQCPRPFFSVRELGNGGFRFYQQP